MFLPCCLQNGGDNLQKPVSLLQMRVTDSRACTQVIPLCVLRSCHHFTRGNRCWDPMCIFCKHLMAQVWSADDRGVTGCKTACQKLHHNCPFVFILRGACMYMHIAIHIHSLICFRHGALVRHWEPKWCSKEERKGCGEKQSSFRGLAAATVDSANTFLPFSALLTLAKLLCCHRCSPVSGSGAGMLLVPLRWAPTSQQSLSRNWILKLLSLPLSVPPSQPLSPFPFSFAPTAH